MYIYILPCSMVLVYIYICHMICAMYQVARLPSHDQTLES